MNISRLSGTVQAIIRTYYVLCRGLLGSLRLRLRSPASAHAPLSFFPAWFRVQQQEPPFAAGSSGRLPDQHGLYHISGSAPRGSPLRPIGPAGLYCSFHAVVFPDRAGKTSEWMGCGLLAHRLAQKRKTAAALGICISQNPPCSALGWRTVPP